MHSCKTTRERMLEADIDAISPSFDDQLSECTSCRNEFEAVKEVSRTSRRAFNETRLSDAYWEGYHARLEMKLRSVSTERQRTPIVRRLLFSSIRIPVPVALAAVLLVAGGFCYSTLTAPAPIVVTSPPQVVQVPLTVPVVQEKVVTRVVYRDRKIVLPAGSQDDSVLAQKRRGEATTLTGFKPLEEIKLTLIKGGAPDEK